MAEFIPQLLHRVDWKVVPAWLSPAIAFVSVCWAIHESRAKNREAAARAADAKKYTQALETVIQYGSFVQHLEGVDKRVGNVADELGRIAKRTADIADLASRQADQAMTSLTKVCSGKRNRFQDVCSGKRNCAAAYADRSNSS